jgi:hypothetical protein
MAMTAGGYEEYEGTEEGTESTEGRDEDGARCEVRGVMEAGGTRS